MASPLVLRSEALLRRVAKGGQGREIMCVTNGACRLAPLDATEADLGSRGASRWPQAVGLARDHPELDALEGQGHPVPRPQARALGIG